MNAGANTGSVAPGSGRGVRCVGVVATAWVVFALAGARETVPCAAAAPPAPATAASAEPTARWIVDLGHPEFAVREAAEAHLCAADPGVYDQVRQALQSPDAEVRERAARVLRALARRRAMRRLEAHERAVAAAATQPDWGAARISGKVVDSAGRPVDNALIGVRTNVTGPLLFRAAQGQTHSDPAGRFTLTAPYADVRCNIWAEKGALGAHILNLLPAATAEEVLFTLRSPVGASKIEGVVEDPQGQAVAQAPVELIGEYGHRVAGQTDAKGAFRFDGLPEYIGQAIVLVRRGEWVSPLKIVRVGGPPLRVQLQAAAHLLVDLRNADHGDLVSGMSITLRPRFANDFQISVRADDGICRIPGIPPGDEYSVEAQGPLEFQVDRPDRRGGPAPGLYVKPAAGETAGLTIRVRRKAVLEGRVLGLDGLPVAGALVGVQAETLRDDTQRVAATRTDSRGVFLLATGRLEEPLTVAAFSPRGGLGATSVPALTTAAEHQGVDVRLPGSVRLRGTVTDKAGRPIPDVACSGSGTSHMTDAQGQFDLGCVSLRLGPDQEYELTCRAPRPAPPATPRIVRVETQAFYPVRDRQTAPSFFCHRKFSYRAAPGGEVDLQVVLDPTALWRFRGTVVDQEGRPAQGAQVHLFAGHVDPKRWRAMLHPPLTGVDRRVLWPITSTVTDAAGRWTLWTVREDPGNGLSDWPVEVPTDQFAVAAEIVTSRPGGTQVTGPASPSCQVRIDQKSGESAQLKLELREE